MGYLDSAEIENKQRPKFYVKTAMINILFPKLIINIYIYIYLYVYDEIIIHDIKFYVLFNI